MKKDAKHVAIAQDSMTVSSVEQFYYEVKPKINLNLYVKYFLLMNQQEL